MLVGLCGAAEAGTSPLQYRSQPLAVDGETYTVRIPRGYQLEVLTTDLPQPRLATFAANGDLFLGSKSGNVYRLPPPYRQPEAFAEIGGYPHSVAFRHGEILIARTDGVYRGPYKPGDKYLDEDQVTLLAALPGGGGHSSRTVGVGPNGKVFVSLGITGNCSNEFIGDGYPFQNRRGGMLVLDENGPKPRWRAFATGLRNPVGFDWHPGTGILYASNNGPDHLGYEQPPEYFSRLTQGSFHGMPWFWFDGTSMQRDRCISTPPPYSADKVERPVATFPARNAPMGVRFIPDGAMQPELEGDAIVALRGSWGTQPTGGFFGNKATRRPPELVIVRFEEGRALRVESLVAGFQLPDGKRWARPVGVAIGPDGALYFTSDSHTEGLYRLRRSLPAKHPLPPAPAVAR